MSQLAAFTSWWSNFAGLTSGASVYTVAGLFVGGVLGYVSRWTGHEPAWAFVFGYCLPFFPMYLLFSSRWALERRLRYLVKLKEDKLIQQKEYDELRKMALRWYGERLFGRAAAEPQPPSSLPAAAKSTPPSAPHPPQQSPGGSGPV